MARTAPTGQIFVEDDLIELVEQKHELGCHTFDHCHSWDTTHSVFKASILRNRAALAAYFPQMRFRTFSYPISVPRPKTKRETAKCFDCCRGGGQDFNGGTIDLAQLRAFFIDKNRSDLSAIGRVIESNARHNGWLIFATHDVSNSPTPFGCTPALFQDILSRAIDSGATILPVSEALDVARERTRSGSPRHAAESTVAKIRT
jgi:peptidoglycan/xylan/chitin deacetylase (PgdA/CDA1 family)